MHQPRHHADSIQLGPRLRVAFERTLRIPDDGGIYPLPPGLGEFPIRRVADYGSRVPERWRATGGVFIPMYQREAMWIYFVGDVCEPNAVKVGVGGINAVSGAAWDTTLRADPQDYLAVPDQPWLDGINAGEGFIRQFVAMPLGGGYTVEGQLTGMEDVGGLQMVSFEPKPGALRSDRPNDDLEFYACLSVCESASVEMGLGAGGRMDQSIYPDRYGMETWDVTRQHSVHVHIANSAVWREITGEDPPPTPVSTQSYVEAGLPWFGLYDEHMGDLVPSPELARVRSIDEFGTRCATSRGRLMGRRAAARPSLPAERGDCFELGKLRDVLRPPGRAL